MITLLYKKSPLALCDNPLNIYDILMEFAGKKIDRYGDVEAPCNFGKINITSYILHCKMNEKIKIKYFSVAKQMMINTTIIFKNEYLYKIRDIFYPQKINYLDVRGIIICELTVDHLLDIINGEYNISLKNQASLYRFILKENREDPKIFISHILPGSDNIDNKNLRSSEGCIILRVNGKCVTTINEFKRICHDNTIIMQGKKYIHLEMMNRENITICLED
jgi:hypothetical protein